MSLEAEKRLIGALLMNFDTIDRVYGILEADMFRNEIYGKAYHEFQRSYDRGEQLNYPVLMARLKEYGYPEYQLIAEIKEAMISTATTADAETNANLLRNEYVAKKAGGILNNAKLISDDIDNQIHDTINQLEALVIDDRTTSMTLSEITKAFQDKYFKPDDTPKISFGFEKLDELIGGLEGGDVCVIGARPAVGKSAFVTQIAMKLATDGKRVGFYNLEMKERQMFERFVVSASGISLTRLKRATRFLNGEEQTYRQAVEKLSHMTNLVISTGSKSITQIRAESRHMNFDIIIIDYLQLVIADKQYRGNRYAEVGAISKAVKSLAMELNIPIIALTQLNRVSEGKETKEPTMAEIRESGDIEQDASVVCLLWNVDGYERKWKGCKVDKNRQGQCGTEVLMFDGEVMRFKETDMKISDFKEKQGDFHRLRDDEIPDFL